MIGLFFLTILYAFEKGYLNFIMIYAITMAGERLIPIEQWTNNEPYCKADSINSFVTSKY